MNANPDLSLSLALTGAPRIFVPGPLHPGESLALPATAANHVARALRLGQGDPLTLFDGRGGEYAARLASIDKARVEVELLGFAPVERESVLRIRLVQCLQGGDKMDFTIQKAVELGVDEIVPVISRRSVVRLDRERAAKRVEHWRAVVVAASEQCGRNVLARVAEIESFDHWLARPPRDGARRLLLSPHAEATVAGVLADAPAHGVELLIGPEGGLAPEESELALARNFCKLRLGPRVLRTETAGLAAIAALHAHWGDFI
jgi:16S rRNA (uracil1498-N3)-methyltransferase